MVDNTTMVDSFDVLVGRNFFADLTAPYTYMDYRQLGIPIRSDRAKAITSFLVDAKPDAFTVHPDDVPATWIMIIILQPIFGRSVHLKDYPPELKIPLLSDGLDVICAVYGHRRIVDMVSAVQHIHRDFSVWESEMNATSMDLSNEWNEIDQMLYGICQEVTEQCLDAEERLWHNFQLISEHASDLQKASYSEKRGSVTYRLGMRQHRCVDLWELIPDSGEWTVAFFCAESFSFSDGRNQAVPLLPP